MWRQRPLTRHPAIKAPAFIGPFKSAITKPAHHDIFTDAQQHKIGVAITVDVHRIGARNGAQFKATGLRIEMQCAALRAGVAVELGRRRAAGQEHVGKAVRVAVESGNPAAHHIFPFTGVNTVNPGAGSFLDEAWDSDGVFGRNRLRQTRNTNGS